MRATATFSKHLARSAGSSLVAATQGQGRVSSNVRRVREATQVSGGAHAQRQRARVLAAPISICQWFALRAGVLRRAVSSTKRPHRTHHGHRRAVGRQARHPSHIASGSRRRSPRQSCVARSGYPGSACPNHCVNLTRNGVAAAGFISFSPAASTPLRAGYTVR